MIRGAELKIGALVVGLLTLPTVAHAQIGLADLYAEGAVGAILLQNVQTKDFSGVVNGVPLSLKGNLNYNQTLAVGGEIGLNGLGYGILRIGASYDYFNAKLSKARLTGTIAGTPVDTTYTRSDVSNLGLSFDDNVNLIGGHLYINLPPLANVQPYFGAGAGMAVIQKANRVPAGMVTAGLRFALGPTQYLGLRYRLYYVESATDNLGVQYDPIVAHSVSVMFGAYF